MTEIVFFRNNKKKTNKISPISYFFPTHFLVHRKVRCPPKVPLKPTSIHVYIYIYVCIYMNKYIYYLFPNSDTVKFVTHMVHMCKTQLNIKMHGEQNIYFLK